MPNKYKFRLISYQKNDLSLTKSHKIGLMWGRNEKVKHRI